MSLSKRVLILLFCLSVAGLATASAQVGETDVRFSHAALTDFAGREKAIRAELRTMKQSWAGEYYYGDGLGVNVRLLIAPDTGFVFTWTGCLGTYDRNYGTVERTGETLKLVFQFPNSRRGFQGLASELVPVKWGARHYLIPLDQMVDFCNAINAGAESPKRSAFFGSRFLLRDGDEKKKATGNPGIPTRFLEYLLKKPIETDIVSVGQIKIEKETNPDVIQRYTRVVIAAGYAEGVRPGMEFFIHRRGTPTNSAKIQEVKEHTAEALVWQIFLETEAPVPAVGWKLSTYLFDEK